MAEQANGLKKGKNNIEMILLSILSEKDYYGYQLSQLIEEYSQGLISIQEGSLYPALYRMLDNGYISDQKVKTGKRLVRIYYHIEPAGREYFRILLNEYTRLNQGIGNILYRKTDDTEGKQHEEWSAGDRKE